MRSFNHNKLLLLLVFLAFISELRAEKPTAAWFNVDDPECVQSPNECYECADSYKKAKNTRQLQWLLIKAIRKELEDCAVHLLELGAKIDYQSFKENLPAPLEAAVFYNRTNIVKYLINAGASPDLPGLSGVPLVVRSVEKGYCQLIPLLFAKGGMFNPIILDQRDQQRVYTPFSLSAILGYFECTRQFVLLGIDINHKIGRERPEFNGNTALMIGLILTHVDYARNLVNELHADTEIRNDLGDTVLLIMVKMGRNEVVKILVEDWSADIYAKDSKGLDSLQIARLIENQELVAYLEEYQLKHGWQYRLSEKLTDLVEMTGMQQDELFVYTASTLLLSLIPLTCLRWCCLNCCFRR